MFDNKKLDKIIENYTQLQEKMLNVTGDRNEYAKLAIEFSNIEDLAKTIINYRQLLSEKTDLEVLVDEEQEDPEMIDFAKKELLDTEKKIEEAEDLINELLLPQDADDGKSVIIEIRAGTGGDEAALFAGDLARMYLRFADSNKWKVEVMTTSEGDFGGYKEFIANI